MNGKYWFAVTFSFVCPSCKKTSVERAAINSTTNDRNKIDPTINQQKLACQLCKAPLIDDVHVTVNVQPISLEQAKGWVKIAIPPDK